MNRWMLLGLASSALLGCGATDSATTLIDSNCAEILCGWQVEQGELTPSGSWHEHQRSIELSGTGARVTRRISGAPNAECFGLRFLADIAPDAQLELQLDFNDDGSIDARAPVPPTQWRSVEIAVRPPPEYRSVRFALSKQGEGSVRISSLVSDPSIAACHLSQPTTLADGALCSTDETCASGRCVLGHCGRCGPGGCAEGEGCRSSDECRDGACAASVCKACAKRGDCATGQGCSITGQCASGSCTQGAEPSLSTYPGVEGICGECDADSDCGGGTAHCVLGRCTACATDADCSGGQVCRYADTFDVSTRACLPKITSTTPRGGLCEQDEDCVSGLRCGASDGRAKRCGVSCVSDRDCGSDGVCAAPGVSRNVDPPAKLALLMGWSEVPKRIATCYRRSSVITTGGACEVQEQCGPLNLACCAGKCMQATFDPDINTCVGANVLP
ncbi:MAG: hypothetical protein JWN48_1698 [Myxococcaceae bacterium]|nr:hypothetical protein [Myxococcaceae bacterium]